MHFKMLFIFVGKSVFSASLHQSTVSHDLSEIIVFVYITTEKLYGGRFICSIQ